MKSASLTCDSELWPRKCGTLS